MLRNFEKVSSRGAKLLALYLHTDFAKLSWYKSQPLRISMRKKYFLHLTFHWWRPCISKFNLETLVLVGYHFSALVPNQLCNAVYENERLK